MPARKSKPVKAANPVPRKAAAARQLPGGAGKRRPPAKAAQAAVPVAASRTRASELCVAGIGASAGGFDAISTLLQRMAPDSGIAFVVIQHLSPTQKSFAVELFARRTAMQVQQASNGMRLLPNHVYIVPAHTYARLQHGELRLHEPDRSTSLLLPVDEFFRSIAEDRQERAIGVVLSGTGADGSLGLKNIVAAGGIVLVQDPATAQFDGMPRSAINTDLATHVLPVEQMPEVLVNYVRHPYVHSATPVAASERDSPVLRAIIDLIRAQHGYDFRGYKIRMLMRRIHRRMGLRHVERLAEYLLLLRKERNEVDALFRDLLIGVTEFFRDPEAWKTLEADVIDPLVRARANGDVIRVWVPGAATGEEAYSVAMMIADKLREHRKPCKLQVFATDTNEQAVASARTGIYPVGIAAQIPPERLRRYFIEIKDDHHYQVNRELREAVVFGVHNLFADPPFSRMDLVTCRNVMIYLEPEQQRRLIQLFHFALRQDGYLFLGPAENIGSRDDLFKPVSRKWRTYRRIGTIARNQLDMPFPAGDRRAIAPLATERLRQPVPQPPATIAQQLMLEKFVPASVLVNARLEVLHFQGPTDRYLTQPRGAPTNDLLLLARNGLRAHVRAGVRRALAGSDTVRLPNLRVRRNGGFVPVKVTIESAGDSADRGRLLLIVFEDEAPPPPRAGRGRKSGESELVRQLEEELRETKDDLQTSIERLETSNEELRVSNEEVVSINEELQSVNEELESSKEELQSLNEELNTVNSQLQAKISEQETANNDLHNLLASSDIATLCLDRDLRIKWFTPATREVLNVIVTDTGRPIRDLAMPLAGESLVRDARAVLDKLAPVQAEIKAENERWYMRRILPYRTEDDRIDGVIVTFADITESKRKADAAMAERKATTNVLEAQVKERTRQLRMLAVELAFAEERERRSVARDLHDELGQILNLAKMKLETTRKRAGAPAATETAEKDLAEVEQLVAQAARSVRSLASQLSPPVLEELGLVPALQWLGDQMQQTYGLAVELNDDGEDKPLEQAPRSIVFRAVRELLINVARHANVGRATVESRRVGDKLEIVVSDAGRGFDSDELREDAAPGLGLLSVRERLSYIGGEVDVMTSLGNGTRVRLRMPCAGASSGDLASE